MSLQSSMCLEGVTSLFGLVGLAWLFGVGGLLGLALGTLAAWLAGQYSLRRTLQEHSVRVIYKGCWQEKGILAGYSLPSFLADMVATPVLWYGMTLVAKRSGGYDDLALYNAAYQWHGPLLFLPMILLSVSTPVLVQQWEQGSIQRFRKVFLWNAGSMLAITAIPLMVIALSSTWIMGLYGAGFSDGKDNFYFDGYSGTYSRFNQNGFNSFAWDESRMVSLHAEFSFGAW